ncbi:MAG: hypothetical protein EPO51_14195 [Phenylobacterium sp.]|uniref:COG3650 family protein n=1 Tax=Phenylobacterium sp. TaxID=1871053 RepID=UPI00121C109B|nr:hypothetical protein [Phenylobacterium sp.]TAJ71433.1 MAG: hypothetical protein EPO51_14195 [Phenylobacterium sp.]
MKRILLLTPLLAALAACQPQAPNGEPAPPPADAPAAALPVQPANIDISKPITAHGTEPFWALNIDGKAFKLTRPDHPDLVAEAPGAAIAEGRAIWVAKTPDGQQMTVTLYASECSDGMSDLKYPLTVEVVLVNESLRGCAAKTAELPREP